MNCEKYDFAHLEQGERIHSNKKPPISHAVNAVNAVNAVKNKPRRTPHVQHGSTRRKQTKPKTRTTRDRLRMFSGTRQEGQRPHVQHHPTH